MPFASTEFAARPYAMNWLDWCLLAAYICGLMVMSFILGRSQRNGKDYYLAGNAMGPLPIAVSTAATQCSTNSLLGAPAFVAFGGGLLWLQYELAVPLAMLVCMLLVFPVFRRLNVTTVYTYLEERYDPRLRLVIASLFMFFRAFGTGITVYGICLVLVSCVQIPYWLALLLVGIATIIYDMLGGLKAVIWSDVLQFGLLFLAIIMACVLCMIEVGGWTAIWEAFPDDKQQAINFSANGFSDGDKYGFWPMLIGGIFLYVSYYGCDQTQAQRELSSRSIEDTQKALFIDGLIRFPLVLTYCFLGVCIGAYIIQHPEFLDQLRIDKQTGLLDPNAEIQQNIAVPVLALQLFPHGFIGLLVVGLFAAAMSSLDSTINSLSAVSTQDVLPHLRKKRILKRDELRWARGSTLFWGLIILACSFAAPYIGNNIIEAINTIGSIYNGPLLAVFLMGMLTERISSKAMLIGFFVGIAINIILWLGSFDYIAEHIYNTKDVAYWWWNAIGFVNAALVAWFSSRWYPRFINSYQEYKPLSKQVKRYSMILIAYFILILFVLINL